MDHQNIFPALRDELALLRQRVVELEAVEASRQQTEEALRTSEKRYRALVETTGTGYCILDAEGRVRSANAEYVRLTGHHTLEEIAGRGVVEWTAEYDRERNAAEVAKCFERGSVRNLEIDYVDRAGQITPVELTSAVTRTLNAFTVVVITSRITPNRTAFEAPELEARLGSCPIIWKPGQTDGRTTCKAIAAAARVTIWAMIMVQPANQPTTGPPSRRAHW